MPSLRPTEDIVEKQDVLNAFTVKFCDLRAAKKAVEDSGKLEIAREKVFTEVKYKYDDCKGRPKDVELPPVRPRGRERGDRQERGRDARHDYPPFAPPPYGVPLQGSVLPAFPEFQGAIMQFSVQQPPPPQFSARQTLPVAQFLPGFAQHFSPQLPVAARPAVPTSFQPGMTSQTFPLT
jgi:hypothetical protein